MKSIFKLGNGQYFEGLFYLRSKDINWATPIDCPTIFEAKGAGIKSGNWRSCTAINTAKYVIENYLNKRPSNSLLSLPLGERKEFWKIAVQIEELNTWETVNEVLPLIEKANSIINKLPQL